MNEVNDLDLPSLQSIRLGVESLSGEWSDFSSSLLMQSLNEMIVIVLLFVDLPILTSIISQGGSFRNTGKVRLESIMNMEVLIFHRYS